MIDIKLCSYIADYIQEEFSRGCTAIDIDKYLIAMAIDAYNNGAAIGVDDDE